MRIRVRGAFGGVAALVGAGLAVGVLLAQPTQAAQGAPAVAAAGTTAGTATATGAPPTVTGSWTGSGTPVPSATTTSSTSCPVYYTLPTLLPGGVALESTFEDGTTDGWYALSGVTVTTTTEVAATGTHSLRIDGMTSTAGARVTVSRLPNWGWYQATAKVRVPGDVPSASFVTLTATSVASAVPGTARVSSDGWATLTTYFRPSTLYADWYCNGSMTGTQVPAPATIGLSVALVTCGEQPIDRPSTVFLDDLSVVGNPGTGTGTASPPPSATTPTCGTTSPPPPAQCTVRQTVQSQWQGGYLASLQITNASPSALAGWTLAWTFPGSQQVQSLWGAASWTQNGRQVSVTGASWAPLAASGGTATVGFVAQGTPGTPGQVTLNGAACGVPSA